MSVFAQRCALAWLLLSLLSMQAIRAADPTPLIFRDVAAASGVRAALTGQHAHAAAWGDVNGDGLADLYVGAFHKPNTTSNRLLIQTEAGVFRVAEQEAVQVSARSSGAVFVDLDHDGDLDLYLSNLGGGKDGHSATANKLFRNDQGTLTDVSDDSGACPRDFRGRSVAALDFNGDGRLDLLVGESIAYGSAKRSRLYVNLGSLKFKDATDDVGLPSIPGLGVAAGDVNNDGWPDLLLVASEGGNRLFLNDRGTKVREAIEVSATLQKAWKYSSGDDATCGACLADVNRDGRLDILLGHHFERPWLAPVAIRLYLNRGETQGKLSVEDVTETAGLKPLPMKAPHLEVHDFDNDGWPDIYVSMVKFGPDGPQPLIFRGRGIVGDAVRYTEDTLALNDYPTNEDRAIQRTGTFFEKMIKDRKIIYTAAAPTCDFNRDGKRDIFLSSWWVESPAMLLKNETVGGTWLQVSVQGDGAQQVNPHGIGARVSAYAPGKSGDPASLQGEVEIAAGYGYSSGQEPIAHLGLKAFDTVDLVIRLPHGRGEIKLAGVKANQHITIKQKD